MKIDKLILWPSYLRKPSFDSISTSKRTFEFSCTGCRSIIVVSFDSFTGNEFGWRNRYDAEDLKAIEERFNMNVVGKSPDGGWTSVFECSCEVCRRAYLLYAGVDEYANSAYKVTLHGISEIIDR